MDSVLLVESSGVNDLALRNRTSVPQWTTAPNITAETVTNANVTLLPFDDVTVAVVATFLFIFLIFGAIANFLTMMVIITSKKLKSIFNLFILSLCVSDFLSSIISWINLYRRTWGFNVFVLPNFFCWFYWGADMWTSYVTALHILSFAILRLVSVWKPLIFGKITTLYARIWILIIWVVAFACGFLPFASLSGAKIPDRTDRTSPTARWPACTQNNETLTSYKSYIKYAYPIFFYIPLVAITIVSIAIGTVILSRKAPGQNVSNTIEAAKRKKKHEKEKQAIIQLVLIVGSFMLGYLPFTIFEFWTLHSTNESYSGWKQEWLFGTIQYMCLRFSECLNPIFYNLASTKLRKETKLFLRKLCCKVTPGSPLRKTTAHTGLAI